MDFRIGFDFISKFLNAVIIGDWTFKNLVLIIENNDIIFS